MKKLLAAFLLVFGLSVSAYAIDVDGFASNSCTVNTSDALTAHATDCTGVTAVADVLCYERDADIFYVCVPTAGDCDTAGEWELLSYVPLPGGTMTGALVLDDTSLKFEEGADTLTITVPALTTDRAVTFTNAAGAVILDSNLDTFSEVQTLVADETLLKAGTLTDTKACIYDTGNTDIVCNSDFLPLSGGTLTGNLLFTDDTYDIGASGDTRPQDIFMSGNLTVGGEAIDTAQDLDVADSEDGNAATATLNPSTNVVIVSCADSDGCDITMGESDTTVRRVVIVNDTANAANFADTAGVSELASGFAMGDNDSLELVYNGSEWVEVSRSNN